MKAEEFNSVHPTSVGSRIIAYSIVLFAAITVFIAFDVAGDYRSGGGLGHILGEGVIMVLALAGIVIMWVQFKAVHVRADQLSVELKAAVREAQRFREEAHDALRGMGEAIDHQFAR